MTNIKKLAENIFLALGILFLLWMLYSWADTVCNNAMPDPQYSPINFIAMVIRGCPR